MPTPETADDITISQVPMRSLRPLERLFAEAVEQHFGYFAPAVQRRVIADHSIGKLLLARIDRRRLILVARNHGQVVGYCIGAVPKRGPAQIFWLYVDPEFRGANVGLKLLSRTLKLMAARGASDIFIATHDHRRYYERQGFVHHGSQQSHGVAMDVLVFRPGRLVT